MSSKSNSAILGRMSKVMRVRETNYWYEWNSNSHRAILGLYQTSSTYRRDTRLSIRSYSFRLPYMLILDVRQKFKASRGTTSLELDMMFAPYPIDAPQILFSTRWIIFEDSRLAESAIGTMNHILIYNKHHCWLWFDTNKKLNKFATNMHILIFDITIYR